MLTGLAIRDIVLIDRLDLEFEDGLGVLTGETGAGKSILLDALGLALGARADSGLVRHGAERASVTASFDPPADHPVFALLGDQGIEAEPPLLLRRTLNADGRGRAFVNDQPCSVTLLRQVGALLVEIQGQFDQRGLFDPATHRVTLDAYGGLGDDARAVAETWKTWRAAVKARQAAEERQARAQAELDWLTHAVQELDALDPVADEETELAETRALLMNGEKLAEAVAGAHGELEEGRLDARLRQAQRALERIAPQAGDRVDPVIAALDRASVELNEAVAALQALAADLDHDPRRLEQVEDRLFALRDIARKHQTSVDALPALRDDLTARLAEAEGGDTAIARLADAEAEARTAYVAAARSLATARAEAAARLDAAVMAELPPLKLDRARFATELATLDEADWGPEGMERIQFLVATNPGAPPGPLGRIASGGELSRFLLALKVVLARLSPIPTLVFDEVDSGIGGATAAAVGERLARLAEEVQVLVITHSPQVAARGRGHYRVWKSDGDGTVRTTVHHLDADERREEIARMLSGADITAEARAAAERLLGAA